MKFRQNGDLLYDIFNLILGIFDVDNFDSNSLSSAFVNPVSCQMGCSCAVEKPGQHTPCIPCQNYRPLHDVNKVFRSHTSLKAYLYSSVSCRALQGPPHHSSCLHQLTLYKLVEHFADLCSRQCGERMFGIARNRLICWLIWAWKLFLELISRARSQASQVPEHDL